MNPKTKRNLKRNIHGEVLFSGGLGAIGWGLVDADWTRMVIKTFAGFVLVVWGLSIIFSGTDSEAGIHSRGVFQKVLKTVEKVLARKDREKEKEWAE